MTAHYAKMSTGWSVHLNGIQQDLDQFADQLHQVGEHLSAQEDNHARRASRTSVVPASAPAAARFVEEEFGPVRGLDRVVQFRSSAR